MCNIIDIKCSGPKCTKKIQMHIGGYCVEPEKVEVFCKQHIPKIHPSKRKHQPIIHDIVIFGDKWGDRWGVRCKEKDPIKFSIHPNADPRVVMGRI